MGKFIAVLLLIVLVIVGFDLLEPHGYGFFSKVGNGKVAVVTEFGKAKDKTLEPGPHFKGFFEVLNVMSVQTQTLTVETAAFSKDIQQVNTMVTLNFNVDKANAVTLYRDVGKNYIASLLNPRVQENTKIIFSHYTAENLVQNRDLLSAEILALMKEDLAVYGINVSAVAIEDIDFTDAFTNAVEAKQVATQERLTAQTQQERMTMEAKAEAERKAISAAADAEVAKIQADAKAYEIEVQAEAEAEANKKVAQSLTDELIEYTQAQTWNGELPDTYMGDSSAIPVISMGEIIE